jgi:tripartite-type tricarboxylate transporter receptor subunit TctC
VALAQGKYPEQPIKHIVALSASGSVDTAARTQAARAVQAVTRGAGTAHHLPVEARSLADRC